MLKRVLQWQSLGTELGTIRFRELFDLDNPPYLLDQGLEQVPVPVECEPLQVPNIEYIDSSEDDSNDDSYTL
jgi:hypothetical protein